MKNITVSKYNRIKNKLKYNIILEHIKPKDSFLNGFNLDKLSYNEVRTIQKLFTSVKTMEDMMKIFTTAYQCKDYLFWNMKIVNYFETKAFLIEKFVSLNVLENKLLGVKNEDSELRNSVAGGRLVPYAAISVIDAYAKLYKLDPEDCGKKSYNQIIFYLSYNIVTSDIDRQVNKLKYGSK
jgi:hypothetical protein